MACLGHPNVEKTSLLNALVGRKVQYMIVQYMVP